MSIAKIGKFKCRACDIGILGWFFHFCAKISPFFNSSISSCMSWACKKPFLSSLIRIFSVFVIKVVLRILEHILSWPLTCRSHTYFKQRNRLQMLFQTIFYSVINMSKLQEGICGETHLYLKLLINTKLESKFTQN